MLNTFVVILWHLMCVYARKSRLMCLCVCVRLCALTLPIIRHSAIYRVSLLFSQTNQHMMMAFQNVYIRNNKKSRPSKWKEIIYAPCERVNLSWVLIIGGEDLWTNLWCISPLPFTFSQIKLICRCVCVCASWVME